MVWSAWAARFRIGANTLSLGQQNGPLSTCVNSVKVSGWQIFFYISHVGGCRGKFGVTVIFFHLSMGLQTSCAKETRLLSKPLSSSFLGGVRSLSSRTLLLCKGICGSMQGWRNCVVYGNCANI